MILECPECHAKFLVADAMIPAAGRTVRCGACAHQWHVMRPVSADDEIVAVDIAPELAPLPPGSNVPAIKKRTIPTKPFKFAVPALAAAWLIFALLAHFPNWLNAPVLKGIYGMMGAHDASGLEFADVHMQREVEGPKTRFVISGSIVNHSSDARIVPTVRVVLNDKQGKDIWSREYPVNQELKAGEVYPFKIANVETSFASSVATIMLDLGHGLQLMMR